MKSTHKSRRHFRRSSVFALSVAVACLSITTTLPSIASAQTGSAEKARAYYFEAQKSFKRKKYQEALKSVEEAERLSGQTGELLLMLKAQSLYSLGRYEAAKTALDAFYTYSPSMENQQVMAPILLDLDKRMEAVRAAEIQAAKDKAEADRFAEQQRYEARLAQAKAEQLAPLIAADKAQKAAILSTPGIQTLIGDVYFKVPNGQAGYSLANSTANEGQNARSGGAGQPGVDSGAYAVYLEAIEYEHVSDLVLVSIQNTLSRRTYSGYWDTSKPLILHFRGGDGGPGGRGETGALGEFGAMATPFAKAKRGHQGRAGGKGGDGGKGGNGANVSLFMTSEYDAFDWTEKLTLDVAGGSGGQGAAGGQGGRGGPGGYNFLLTKQRPSGKKGYSGAKGVTGKMGSPGFFAPIAVITEDQFEFKGIKLHKDSGPVSSQDRLEDVADQSVAAIIEQNKSDQQAAALLASAVPDGSDRDAQPITRIPPAFPPLFLQGDYSGYCKVRFDVNAEGQTFNIVNVQCTNELLEAETIIAIQKWKYNPKIIGGRPAVRSGVEATIKFALADDRGMALPMPLGY